MADYTPGPWKIGFDDGSGTGISDGKIREGAWITTDDESQEVVVWGGNDCGKSVGVCGKNALNKAANARVIAAAPEMLEALKAAFDTIPITSPEVVTLVANAINLAEGE